jgi:transcriptional regulator with XRE-family HTH domain
VTKIETVREYRREVLEKDAGRAAGEAVLVRLATRLYALRTSLKLTQEEIATRVGLDQASISDIENGDANPTVRTLGRLASGLGVEASRLLEAGSLAIRFGSAVNLRDEVKWQGAVQANRTATTKFAAASTKGFAVRSRKKVGVG